MSISPGRSFGGVIFLRHGSPVSQVKNQDLPDIWIFPKSGLIVFLVLELFVSLDFHFPVSPRHSPTAFDQALFSAFARFVVS